MPDPRSVMQEFRTLDAKRLARGLSPEEERRFAELRDLVDGEPGAGAPRGGFDVNAAAARLRESLLPAGLRNRPPPPPEVSPEPEPEPFFPAPATAPLEAAAPAEANESPFAGGDPEAALFDPATLGWEGGDTAPLDAHGQPWDPNAVPFDANGQPWDPNAVPLDANGQPWDPNAVPLDANGQPWDPNAVPLDANGQPWDPNAVPLDANGQPWDPNAVPLDASGQPWDPNAVPLDANGQPWDPYGAPVDPGAQAWDPHAAAWDPAAAAAWETGAPSDGAGLWDPASLAAPDAAPVDGAAPPADATWDPAAFPAEVAPEPTRALALGDAGPTDPLSELDLDGAALELEPMDDAELVDAGPRPGGDASASGAGLAAQERWSVPELDPAMPSGSAFDAAPAPEPTEILGLASEPEPTLALSLSTDPEPLPPGGWDPEPAPALAGPGTAFGTYDELAAAGPGLAAGDALEPLGEHEAGFDAPPAHDHAAPIIAPAASYLGEYDDVAGFAPGATFELPPDAGFEAGGALAPASLELGDGGEWQADDALDPSFALASGGSFDAAAEVAQGWATSEARAPWEAAPQGAPPLESLPLDLDAAVAPDADGVTESHPLPPAVSEVAAGEADDLSLPEIVEEELPTIDGEDILEEIPADEAGFAPPEIPVAPAPVAAAAAVAAAPGSHRVVVHTIEGTVKRGVIEDADLAAAAIVLSPAPGEAAESVPTGKVKAIFFMLAPGEAAPAAQGKKVRVTFRDGRQVAGYSPDYAEDGPGFFMIPGDARTNTGRIWVYRAAVKQVVVS